MPVMHIRVMRMAVLERRMLVPVAMPRTGRHGLGMGVLMMLVMNMLVFMFLLFMHMFVRMLLGQM